jgi:hypothetical protein
MLYQTFADVPFILPADVHVLVMFAFVYVAIYSVLMVPFAAFDLVVYGSMYQTFAFPCPCPCISVHVHVHHFLLNVCVLLHYSIFLLHLFFDIQLVFCSFFVVSGFQKSWEATYA